MKRRTKRTGRGPVPPGGPAMQDVFFALNCETRVEILQLLAHGELDVSTIAKRLELALNTISENLRTLWEAGILDIESRGSLRVYRLSELLRATIRKAGVVLRIPCQSGAAVIVRMPWTDFTDPSVIGRLNSEAPSASTSSAASAR